MKIFLRAIKDAQITMIDNKVNKIKKDEVVSVNLGDDGLWYFLCADNKEYGCKASFINEHFKQEQKVALTMELSSHDFNNYFESTLTSFEGSNYNYEL